MRLRISRYLVPRALWIALAASVALPWAGCGSEDTPTTSTGPGSGPGAGPGGAGGSGGAGGPGGAGGAGATGGAAGAGGNVTCGADEKDCGGQCVAVDDPQYGCGAGCAPCDLPSADPLCSGGTCQIATCDPGFADCNADDADGCEIEIAVDPDNCNACGNQCVTPNAEPQCAAGACAVGMCQAPYQDCDADPSNGCEALVGSDPQHCAGCNMPCAPGEQCQAGACGVFCAPGLANCDNDALNGCETTLGTLTDCGFCGDACDLANATSACMGGACQVSACDAGAADCDNMDANGCETNTDGSALDCGACGVVCPGGPNSTPICVQGACDLSCDGGFEDCDGVAANGCEAATTTDVQNCGGCGVVCPAPNGTATCVAGQCGLSACAPGFADCNGSPADGCEVNTTTSTTHCGTCGNTCPDPANGDASCNAGACEAACDPGWANCNGSLADGCEVNVTSDAANCGGCGAACNVQNGSGACFAGSCGIGACDPGWANCNLLLADGCEANTDSELNNCGGCGLICLVANGAPACSGGSCEIASCNPGAGDCNNDPVDGCEVNISGNANHCGTCGNQCSIANGSPVCTAGACQVGSCNSGWTNCDGSAGNGCEVHTDVDVTSCGACGNACTTANGTPACSGGACAVGSCNAGYGNCDGSVANGCEVNTQTSVGNCGSCGNACTTANGTPACSGGACAIASCSANFADCDGNVANGCEVNTQTSVGNCGSCGNACTTANGTPACSGGGCAIASCNAGYSNCDGNVANGCEVNTQTSVGNCGSCGNVCTTANGTPTCASGACAIGSCSSGYANCDGSTGNGCEVNTQTSVGNCGSCGNACTTANGTPACSSGACAVGSCNAGYGNCDGNAANGCEVNLLSSVGNCGLCGNACTTANGTPACAGGACAVGTCNAGWGNCDSNVANGCETNTQTSPTHCGACGNTCSLPNAVAACSAGGCVIASCNPGYANCDGIAANGCEINTQTSLGNCGVCGNACSVANGAAACLSGSCAVASCNSGWGNCDGNVANGCETNTQTSVGNCGSCGNACSVANGSPTCSSGSCAVSSCNAGFQNCDGVVSNGCEINTTNDAANCGGCGNACSSVCTGNVTSTTCGSSVCSISGCAGSYNNTDGVCTNGCECLSSNVSSVCSLPASLGTVNLGGTTTTTANLVPAGKENWYTVTFTGNTSTAYHPRVRFTSNPGNAFRFDIRTNCSGGTMACGTEGGVSNGITDWETFKPAANGYNTVIPPVGSGGVVLIRVYRAGGAPVTCDNYTLTISN